MKIFVSSRYIFLCILLIGSYTMGMEPKKIIIATTDEAKEKLIKLLYSKSKELTPNPVSLSVKEFHDFLQKLKEQKNVPLRILLKKNKKLRSKL